MDPVEESTFLSELRNQLEISEREKKALQAQLFEANRCVAQLKTKGRIPSCAHSTLTGFRDFPFTENFLMDNITS